MRISDWSSDVCSSDLIAQAAQARRLATVVVRKQDFHEGKTTKFREFTGYDSAHHGIEPSSRRERRSQSKNRGRRQRAVPPRDARRTPAPAHCECWQDRKSTRLNSSH